MGDFQVIKHRGRVDKFTLPEQNVIVKRQKALYIPEWEQNVPCAEYDEHFIYLNPDKSMGSSSYKCTCGSAGVVATPFGARLFVCLNHATYGFHATSQVNKKDFEAGREVKVMKGRKWQ